MDALSQAIESFWSVNATEESQEFSLRAIEGCMMALPQTITEADVSSRIAMITAAHYAGKAINIAKTTASHALSYPITSHYNIPHGHAVMLSLPSMILYNAAATADNLTHQYGIKHHQRMLQQLWRALAVRNANEAADKLRAIMKTIGLETDFGRLGIENTALIAAQIDPVRMKNNPRILTKEALDIMLSEL